LNQQCSLCMLNAEIETVEDAASEITRESKWHRLEFNSLGQETFGPEDVALLYRADPYTRPEYAEALLQLVSRNDVAEVLVASGIEQSAANLLGQSDHASPLRQESFLLILKVDERIFAFCTGHATTSLPFSTLVPDFGLRCVLQEIDHDRFRELALKEPGKRGFMRRETLNEAGRAHRFTLNTYYGSLTKIVGEVEEKPGLTIKGKPKKPRKKKLEGAQGIKVKWPSNRSEAERDARKWFKTYNGNKPIPSELQDICSIREMTSKVDILNCKIQIFNKMKAGENVDLAIVPYFPEDIDLGKYILFRRIDPRKAEYESIHFDYTDTELVKSLILLNCKDDETFITAKVNNDPGTATGSPEITSWISACFLSSDGSYKVLDGGRCYEIHQDFLKRLHTDAVNVLDHFDFPHKDFQYRFLDGEKEDSLNRSFAKNNQYIFLDKGEFRIIVDGSPLELCDVLDPKGVFYVTKRYKSADSIVKAVSQVLDASDALRVVETYWPELVKRANISVANSPSTNPEAWRFVIMLSQKAPSTLVESLTFKGKLELRRFRDQMRTNMHDYGVATVTES